MFSECLNVGRWGNLGVKKAGMIACLNFSPRVARPRALGRAKRQGPGEPLRRGSHHRRQMEDLGAKVYASESRVVFPVMKTRN